MTPENPFLKIRTVGLLYWSIYDFILIGFVLILVDRVLPMGKLTMENIVGCLFYLWLYYWIYSKTKQGNIDNRLFLQRTSNTKWLHLMGLVLCLILFSVGSSSLIANLLIYIRPSLLKLNIAPYDHKQS